MDKEVILVKRMLWYSVKWHSDTKAVDHWLKRLLEMEQAGHKVVQ